MTKNIYFAGSIRGGRDDAAMYEQIIGHLQKHGTVLTEHVGNLGITGKGEANNTDLFIHNRDMEWLTSAEIIVAEVTTPSLGVGYEIAKATILNKKVLCLYRPENGKKLSAMIAGCPSVTVCEYQNFNEATVAIDTFMDNNGVHNKKDG
ncbi:MAG: nucleoside 2-deoxyribosyltransferase [Candidatus Margulisiibacteriota bacterium]|nr:MAG: nucleoside 2-deoxyribosyltransferase [Candidatus Margulisiibacteriota bacterium]HCY36829.1 nucleoside 2-deoxyribosyltransferase [Candidatus Margulisiibacteriota bacterium]